MNKIILGLFLLAAEICQGIKPPAPVLPIPDQKQLDWQEMETYAFVHFGLNTFNDLEWGFGNTPAATFNPTDLDCDQWARTIKAAGLKGIMLTAKHHDGFCLWPSKYTEYSVKNSPWRNGKGDLVKELSDACRKYGLKFGIYLSPWDRNHAEYGRPEYTEYFHKQMEELLSNYGQLFEYWFDGANGGDGWYGGANERRSIDPKTYYQYERARATINRLQPKAVIFGGTCPDIRWIGNEEGWAGETNWSTYDEDRQKHHTEAQYGMIDGKNWEPGECDVSIRPGWFYHAREDHQVRSLSHLVDLYYRSVGHNANFLLNFPVALNGKIHPVDSVRAVEWHKTISAELKDNLLKNAEAEAGNYRGKSKKFAPGNVTDGRPETYWATDDNLKTGTLTLSFPEKTAFNRLVIQEYLPLGQRVIAFNVEYEKAGEWLPAECPEKTTTVGHKRILRFPTVESNKIRINFTDAKGPLCISNVEAFLAPLLITEPVIGRNRDNKVSVSTGDREAEIYYTLDGSAPTTGSLKYEGPFTLERKATVKAISYDRSSKRQSPASIRNFDIPATRFSLTNLGVLAQGDQKKEEELQRKSREAFDGSGYTTFYLPAGAKQEMTIDAGEEYDICGFTYTPDQSRWGGGTITHYEFYVDGKQVAAGEFSNIKNNPIEQVIHFPSARGRHIRLVATTINGGKSAGIAEFSLITK